MIAAILRLFHLGLHELWLDEAFTFHMATTSHWMDLALRENSPPLYYLLVKPWVSLAGESEAAFRALAALFGVLFVAGVIWAGWEIFTPSVGLWCGLVATFSPLHIYYSQEARPYTLLMLSLLMGYVTLWRAVREGTFRRWAWFAGSATLALYTHYFALFGLAPSIVLVLWYSKADHARRCWIGYLTAGAVSGLLLLPWVVVSLLFGARTEGGHSWIAGVWERTPPLLAMPKTLEVFGLGNHEGIGLAFVKQFANLEFPLGWRLLGIAGLTLVGCVALGPWGDRDMGLSRLPLRKAWVTSLLLVPLMCLWGLSLVRPYYVVGRYDLIAFPGYILLLGLGLGKLQRVARRGPYLVGGLALLLAMPIAAKLILYYGVTASVNEGRVTAKLLHSSVRNGDVVVFTGTRGMVTLYYLRRLGYHWQDEFCESPRQGRRFACLVYPNDGSALVFDFAHRTRITYSLETARSDIPWIVKHLERSDSSLWVVFGGYWNKNTVDGDAALVTDLGWLGFGPQESSGVFMDAHLTQFRRT